MGHKGMMRHFGKLSARPAMSWGSSKISFVAQLSNPTQEALKVEKKAPRAIVPGPFNWILPEDIYRIADLYGRAPPFHAFSTLSMRHRKECAPSKITASEGSASERSIRRSGTTYTGNHLGALPGGTFGSTMALYKLSGTKRANSKIADAAQLSSSTSPLDLPGKTRAGRRGKGASTRSSRGRFANT